MKNFIKLTMTGLEPTEIFINVDHIAHIYHVKAIIQFGPSQADAYTRIGVTTNSGGFKVTESLDQVLELIKNAK